MSNSINYQVKSVDVGSHTYHFVTRGRSKPFTDDEVNQFLDEMLGLEAEEDSTFTVSGPLRRIFAQDLKLGLEHCSLKYGASQTAIMKEAKRLFPQQNLERIVGQ